MRRYGSCFTKFNCISSFCVVRLDRKLYICRQAVRYLYIFVFVFIICLFIITTARNIIPKNNIQVMQKTNKCEKEGN